MEKDKMEEFIDEPNQIMALKAIDELRFKVGRRYLVDVLRGKKTERAVRHRFDKNRYFGCLGGFTKEDTERLLSELEYKGLIEVKKPDPNKYYTVVCLTKKGKKEISNKGKGDSTKKIIDQMAEPVTDDDRRIFSLLGDFLKGLNDFQKKAVIDNSRHILCVAGAGTGKTKVLTKRIEFLSKLKNIGDEKILAITFTRKARKEMIKRLEDMMPGNNLQVETFNSFCEKMLLRSGHLIYDRNYGVLDFRKRILLVNHVLKEMGHTQESAVDLYFSHRKHFSEDKMTLYLRLVNDLFAVMDHYRNMKKELSELKDAAKDGCSGKEIDTAGLVLGALEKIAYYKKKLGYRDYTDQIVHTMELFSRFPGTIPKFEHVLVDEYQDVNNMQIRLIEQLNPGNIFAVGDPRQSIFGWRGSEIRHITGFKEKYPKCKALELKINYRSKEGIIKTLNSVIRTMGMPEISCCEKNASAEKDVLLVEHDNEEAEHLFVAQSILSLKTERKEVFVLARTNRQLDRISKRLRQFRIDFIKRTVEDKKSNIEPKENQITLSTIHAIKGLEASTVYVIGANDFNFPCRASEHPILDILKTDEGYDKYGEELRVLYVALSRAKSKLIISYYSTLTHFIDDRTTGIIQNDGVSNDKGIMGGGEERGVKSYKDTVMKLSNGKLGHIEKRDTREKSGSSLSSELRRWRLEKSKELKLLPFHIFSDKTLNELCVNRPSSVEELYEIYGLGPNKVRRFGEEILRIVFEN
ncbi:UvrD-helicase domain-containing protein [Candidatus Woesearchaeota archaeon]|nr:UvrD-helicase domain-containing protein [Candidatus Woesearchaeota archaeon]